MPKSNVECKEDNLQLVGLLHLVFLSQVLLPPLLSLQLPYNAVVHTYVSVADHPNHHQNRSILLYLDH